MKLKKTRQLLLDLFEQDSQNSRYTYEILKALRDSPKMDSIEFCGTRYTELDDEIRELIIKYLKEKNETVSVETSDADSGRGR